MGEPSKRRVIDSAKNVNEFLRLIGCDEIKPKPAPKPATRESSDETTVATSAARAYPEAGEATGSTPLHTKNPNSQLKESRFAHDYTPGKLQPFGNFAGVSRNLLDDDYEYDFETRTRKLSFMTPTQIRLLARIKERDEVTGYQKKVMADFKANTQESVARKEAVPLPPSESSSRKSTSTDTVPFPPFEDSKQTKTDDNNKVTQDTSTDDKSQLPIGTTQTHQESPIPTSLMPDNAKAAESTVENNTPKSDNARLTINNTNMAGTSSQGSPTVVVTGEVDSDGDHQQTEIEDRENLSHFKSWGTPPARNKPRSCVRKIIINGLPFNCDLALVQSLIHGGAIESYQLSTNVATGSTTAYVTFTTGEACDAYYDKYPNGLTFKHQGKTHTIFVDKAKDVDVVSGMMQGYLDCGATRVVQAVGADDDWSMKALHKIAEGDKQARVVEKIITSSQNDVYIITFRFTSITHAVQFRGNLMRDADWEGCEIRFVADPCEKATGVHFE